MSAPRPYALLAELTYRCPLRCLYCSNPIDYERNRGELAAGEWERVFAEGAALGVVQVHLSGGEPLSRGDLEEIVAAARNHDLYSNLITGGTALDTDRLARLCAAGLDHIQLSLQDSNAGSADFVAGARAHRRKLEVARIIKRAAVPLTINVVIHRYNIDRLREIIALAVNLGADRLELASTQFYAWALENRRALMPTVEQNRRAEESVRAAAQSLGDTIEIAFVRSDYLAGEPKACMGGWGRSIICVDPSGRVMPCQAADVIPGLEFDNVRQHSLADIWRDSPAMNAFRGRDWMLEPCRGCPRSEADFGGCRCQAFLLTGDAAATDPACRLSPHHRVIPSARAHPAAGHRPEPVNEQPVYRDVHNSRRHIARLTE